MRRRVAELEQELTAVRAEKERREKELEAQIADLQARAASTALAASSPPPAHSTSSSGFSDLVSNTVSQNHAVM